MDKILPTYIDIEEFTTNANGFYERAKKGEKIFVMIDGRPAYEVHANIDEAADILSCSARPKLTPNEYDELLEMLDPLKEVIG